jgi:hypothetical protein
MQLPRKACADQCGGGVRLFGRNARRTIWSVGKRNGFAHSSAKFRLQLEDRGYKVYRGNELRGTAMSCNFVRRVIAGAGRRPRPCLPDTDRARCGRPSAVPLPNALDIPVSAPGESSGDARSGAASTANAAVDLGLTIPATSRAAVIKPAYPVCTHSINKARHSACRRLVWVSFIEATCKLVVASHCPADASPFKNIITRAAI